MSQEQERRPDQTAGIEPIKYGDVSCGFECGVGRDDMTDIARDKGVTVSQAEIEGTPIVTEAVGEEVLAQYTPPSAGKGGVGGGEVEATHIPDVDVDADADVVTIGEALELAALSAGDKPVDESDAAAIQAAEVRATGLGHVVPGGIGAEAQRAGAVNIRTTRDEQKTKLSDVLTDATSKLVDDKLVTKEDAVGVVGAEIRNKPDLATYPGGVAASMAAAANLNKDATSKLVDDKPVTKEDAVGVVGAEIRNKPDLATYPGGVAASMAAAANLNKV